VLADIPAPHETVAKSTSATRSTYQALAIIRRSGGTAAVVGNEAILHWQQRLAGEEGLYVEPASAGALAAIDDLCRVGQIAPSDNVVALLTASGLKDPDATAAEQGGLITVPGDVDSAFSRLRELKLIS
jgi:threonine synthase